METLQIHMEKINELKAKINFYLKAAENSAAYEREVMEVLTLKKYRAINTTISECLEFQRRLVFVSENRCDELQDLIDFIG